MLPAPRWIGPLIACAALVSSAGCPAERSPVAPSAAPEPAPPTSDVAAPATPGPEAAPNAAAQPTPDDLDALRAAEPERSPCVEACLRRNQMVAMAWDAIVAQCERSCAAAAAESPPPPPP